MAKLIWASNNDLELRPTMERKSHVVVDRCLYCVYTDSIEDEELIHELEMKIQPLLNEYIQQEYHDSSACLSNIIK